LLSSRSATLDRIITRSEGRLALLTSQRQEVEDRRTAAESLQETLTAALAVLQELEGAWRRSFESRLSSVVSDGLTAIFGEEIKLEVKSTVKRDATSMQLVLTQGGIEIDDIVGGTGGSLVSVLDVLLKILLLVSAPDLRRVLVLDEAFRMVEARHLPALGQLLRELSQRLDMQFILVSHETELLDAADIVYEVANGGVKCIKSQHEERQ
jgi:hypothetical protein